MRRGDGFSAAAAVEKRYEAEKVSFEVERDATTLNLKSRTPNLLFDH